MATIKKYTKKDGSTAYQFNAYLGIDPLTGKSKRTTRRGFKTQKEAKLALAQLQLNIESNSIIKKDYSTFKNIYELWFENYKLTVRNSTSQRVTYLFNSQILPEFGEKRINKITTPICQKIVNKWNSNGAPNRLRSYTKKIFQYAISLSIIDSNPMDNILIPRNTNSNKEKVTYFFDKLELNSFLSSIEENENLGTFSMFHTLAYTGLRKGELTALNWADIDFNNNTLSVSKTGYYLDGKARIEATKTSKSVRDISLDDKTVSLLKKWKFEQKQELLSRGIRIKKNNEQLIFNNEENRMYYNSFLNEVLKRYKDYNITPHGFRHTHASLLFEAGASIKQVQERLGHKNINTTLEIYTHVTKETEKETAKSFLKYMEL